VEVGANNSSIGESAYSRARKKKTRTVNKKKVKGDGWCLKLRAPCCGQGTIPISQGKCELSEGVGRENQKTDAWYGGKNDREKKLKPLNEWESSYYDLY